MKKIILTIKTCVNGSTLNTPSYASGARSRILLAPRRLARARSGSSGVEYGFILAVIVLVLFVGLIQMADVTQKMWSDISASVLSASRTR